MKTAMRPRETGVVDEAGPKIEWNVRGKSDRLLTISASKPPTYFAIARYFSYA